MKFLNRNLVTLSAKQEFADWLKTAKPSRRNKDLHAIDALLPGYTIEIEDQNTQCICLEGYAREIIENLLAESFYIARESWPAEIDFDLFSKWFTVHFKEGIYDLPSRPLLSSEI